MKQPFLITHFYHSGFSVAGKHTLLIFDYWRGERGELTPDIQLTPEKLRAYDNVFVFISHEHIDHLDPIVFTWNEAGNVSWIVSSDMPVGTRGKRMAPGDTLRLSEEVTVTAFDTMQEIEEADQEFRKAVQPISREQIDVAFFPVDPRQGAMFEAGANYFILAVKPRILIPMHYFHRADTAMEYARIASCRTTEVLAMPVYGDSIMLEEDEDGYLNISHPFNTDASEPEVSEIPVVSGTTEAPKEIPAEKTESILQEDDPFLESDLPLTSLATESTEPSEG